MGGLLVALVMKYADNVVRNTIHTINVPLCVSQTVYHTKGTRSHTHTHTELIRE